MTNIFSDKKILVAGGTGLVGQQLVPKLITLGGKVFVASLDDKSLVNNKVEDFYNFDLMNLDNCIKITKDKEIVFNLLGVTGSPKTNIEKPASFMMSNIYCAINLLMAAQISKVKKYLYTSTYGVYGRTQIMKENDVWKTFPSDNDKFAGWAKRIGELQVEAFKIEYDFESLHIVRPASIYGPYANFDPENSMVISSQIRRIIEGENPLVVWGDGSAVRDFIFSEDVANAMIQVVQKKIEKPINIGSGSGISIKELVGTLISSKTIKKKPKVIFDKTKPAGDKMRILDTSLAKSYRIINNISLKEGLDKTINWYLNNQSLTKKRFNYFKKNNL